MRMMRAAKPSKANLPTIRGMKIKGAVDRNATRTMHMQYIRRVIIDAIGKFNYLVTIRTHDQMEQ
jgi:hypothetical protein